MKTADCFATWCLVGCYFFRSLIGSTATVQPSYTYYGCKFAPSLCERDEVCFDDNLFGSCQGRYQGNLDRYTYVLDAELRSILEAILSDLVDDGYTWHDPYVQCIVGTVLRGYRRLSIVVDVRACSRHKAIDDGALNDVALSKLNSYLSATYSIKENSADREVVGSNRHVGVKVKESQPVTDLSPEDWRTLDLLLQLVRDSNDGVGGGDEASKRDPRLDAEDLVRAAAPTKSNTQSHTTDTADIDELLRKIVQNEISVDNLSADQMMELTSYVGELLDELPKTTAAPLRSALIAPLLAKGVVVAEDVRKKLSPSDAASRLTASQSVTAKSASVTNDVLWEQLEGIKVDLVTDRPLEYKIAEATPTVESPSLSNDTVDYAWMMLSSSVDMEKALLVVATIADMLGVENDTMEVIRVKDNKIFFKTAPESEHPDGTDVMKIIADHKMQLEKEYDISILQIGLEGMADSQSHAESSIEAVPIEAAKSKKYIFIIIFVLCGAIVGVGGALAFICIVRRCQSKRGWTSADKDSRFSGSCDDETGCLTHDYEDLIRQHIHSKTAAEQTDSLSGNSLAAATAAGAGDETDCGGGACSPGSSHSSWSEEPATSIMDVSTGHMILTYMEDHLKNKDRLESEWQSLCTYQADLSGVEMALMSRNKRKNRYPNVLPYDHNRVVLDEKNNVAGEDYINASFVTDHDPRSASYIAAQGPLAHTVADFWQMVWERGAVVMVMLTKLSEHGAASCHRYWPSGSSELYHIYEVHLVSEHVWCDDYLVRSFYLKNLETNETRTITQFHFLAWPENGVPACTKSLLDFRRKMNKSFRGRACPIVVVCSDGAGRTGAFMLLDMVINRLHKGAKEIDIAATLEHIRDQRMVAVKTKDQFEFILSAIADEIQAMLQSLAH